MDEIIFFGNIRVRSDAAFQNIKASLKLARLSKEQVNFIYSNNIFQVIFSLNFAENLTKNLFDLGKLIRVRIIAC